MKKWNLLLLLLLCAGLCYAQKDYKPYPFSVGVQLGTTHFLGDLGGASGGNNFFKDTDIESARMTFGLSFQYNLGAHLFGTLNLNYLKLSGNDIHAGVGAYSGTEIAVDDPQWYRYYRHLNFRSPVWEVNLNMGVIPYNFIISKHVISPYITGGIGLFSFKPQGIGPYGQWWVDLKPLSTEGQGLIDRNGEILSKRYKLTQINIPLGVGIRWTINEQYAIGFEGNYRLTFTDYLDDVSGIYVDPQAFYYNMTPDQADLASLMARKSVLVDPGYVNGSITAPGMNRGDPSNKDTYYTITMKFIYSFTYRPFVKE